MCGRNLKNFDYIDCKIFAFEVKKSSFFSPCLTTQNRGIKATKKLKGLIVENCRCLKYDVQPTDTSVTIDLKKGRYLYSV